MDLKEIQELLKLINKSELTEVEIEQKDFRIRVRRKAPDNIFYQSAPPSSQPAPPQLPAASQPQLPAPQHDEPQSPIIKPVEEKASYVTFKSPIIGTFYRSPSPDKDAFVKVGDKIARGQVVCIIEAMKLFNEIESDLDGTIVKILVENSQPVEYDQPLFLIEPH